MGVEQRRREPSGLSLARKYKGVAAGCSGGGNSGFTKGKLEDEVIPRA
jgi:hypothetical protein